MSRRQAAIAELRTRAARILTSNGFQTDAGAAVFIAEAPTLGPEDPPAAIAIAIGDDDPAFQAGKIILTLPVELMALVLVADLDDPWSTVEALIADIKTAVEIDHDLAGTLQDKGLERGATKPLKREEGSAYVGASIAYKLTYSETWGRP